MEIFTSSETIVPGRDVTTETIVPGESQYTEWHIRFPLQNCTLRSFDPKFTVKPLITNTSEEYIKCRLDNFSMSFILCYVNFSICKK